jgi:FKBP-type peptidyl-prolyl cis-trans isomerase FklB
MGESPRLSDTVKVHYQGTLIDGTIFDSSIQRGQPISFPVGGVIAGWTEALQLMKVGDKWQLFIPARLAYGDQSPTQAIPPNSVLIFEVELLDIEK